MDSNKGFIRKRIQFRLLGLHFSHQQMSEALGSRQHISIEHVPAVHFNGQSTDNRQGIVRAEPNMGVEAIA